MSRTVFVTGSGRGIGLGIARAFAANGDRVILNARSDAETLNAAAAGIRLEFGAAAAFLADMSDYDAARECFRQIEATFGSVEVLVNNAGVSHFGLFAETQPSDWDRLLHGNLYTALNACHLALPAMLRAKNGVIVNISSAWGIAGASCEAVYAASKGAVNAFTKSLAKEFGLSGIRVNAIACGAFDTRMNARLTAEERQMFAESVPLGRFGQPEEAGALSVFLASDAARYLTGQIIPLDGGLL